MGRSTQLDLALNVHDLAAAGPDPAGDPRRMAKREAAELDHAETVDLAHMFTGGSDESDLPQYAFAHTIA